MPNVYALNSAQKTADRRTRTNQAQIYLHTHVGFDGENTCFATHVQTY
ncbi:MAG: hypothetical protein WAV76_12120 [Bacteroidota bacterium]